jgi:hypothetical protein
MAATLIIVRGPEEKMRTLTIDCQHGTTTLVALDGPVFPSDHDLVTVLVDRHYREMSECRCKVRTKRGPA